MSGPNITSDHISYIERTFLDGEGPVDLSDSPRVTPADGSLQVWRVQTVPGTGTEQPGAATPAERMAGVLTGLSGIGHAAGMAVVGEPSAITLYIASWVPPAGSVADGGESRALARLLDGAYPGVELEPVDASAFRRRVEPLTAAALVTGNPARPDGRQPNGARQRSAHPRLRGGIDRVIDAMQGERWAYVAVANPLDPAAITDLSDAALNELRSVQNTRQRTDTDSPIAATYQETLDDLRVNLAGGRTSGAWHAVGYVLADNAETLGQAKAVATGVFGGPDSRPAGIHAIDARGGTDLAAGFAVPTVRGPEAPGTFTYPYRYPAVLDSGSVAAVMHLPADEAVGFHVRRQPQFDVTPHDPPAAEDAVAIGTTVDAGRPTARDYTLAVDDLAKHGLVVGTTGSGKTNTVFHLLHQLAERDVPFLVVEPAKTEYRSLLTSEVGEGLQVFTLGDETLAPFRINPFEVRPGVSVQTHIDHLTALFNASFVMYAPMPYVLEQCIHEIYADQGWDLVTGENPRGRHPEAHPTMTDLYEKIDPVVASLGYDQEITQDVSAALKTRIDNLRIGSKGLMLDTSSSVPIDDLLARPTILELDAVGDDAEKAFLMGLVLFSLYEHYQAGDATTADGLQHVTVVEEAHRLLSEGPSGGGPDAADMAGQAVESFTNLLAEIRAYGEGVLVVDQTPAKLAPSVVKNTNLKVVHRLLAADDRGLVGGSIGADAVQTDWLGLSGVGEAAVFGSADDTPILVQVPYRKLDDAADDDQSLSEQITARAAAFRESHREILDPYPWAAVDGSAVRRQRRAVRSLVTAEPVRDALTRCVHAIGGPGDLLGAAVPDLVHAIVDEASSGHPETTVVPAIVLGTDRHFDALGRARATPFEDVEAMKAAFLDRVGDALAMAGDGSLGIRDIPGLDTLGATGDPSEADPSAFRERYATLFANPTCPCTSFEADRTDGRCRYQFDVARIADDRLADELADAVAGADGDLWARVAAVTAATTDRILQAGTDPAERQAAAICVAVHAAERVPSIDDDRRTKLVRGLDAHFQTAATEAR